jgi:hypothetical protein
MEQELMLGDHSLKADIIQIKTKLFSLSAELRSLNGNPILSRTENGPGQEGTDTDDANHEKSL